MSQKFICKKRGEYANIEQHFDSYDSYEDLESFEDLRGDDKNEELSYYKCSICKMKITQLKRALKHLGINT